MGMYFTSVRSQIIIKYDIYLKFHSNNSAAMTSDYWQFITPLALPFIHLIISIRFGKVYKH